MLGTLDSAEVSSPHYCKEIVSGRQESCNTLTSNRRISAVSGLFVLFFRIDYVTVVDEALKSQEKTNRALTESLESYREVVERANASQEQSVKLAQGFFESLESEVRSQTENNQALLQGLAEQSGKQWEMMEAMVRESMEASMRMFDLPFPYGGPAGSRKDPE